MIKIPRLDQAELLDDPDMGAMFQGTNEHTGYLCYDKQAGWFYLDPRGNLTYFDKKKCVVQMAEHEAETNRLLAVAHYVESEDK